MLSPQPRFKINSSAIDYYDAFKWILKPSFFHYESVNRLEKSICRFVDSRHAIAIPQARVGIYLAIKSINKGDNEVILSPNTIADVINMVICAGCRPVFCDIDPMTGNIDPFSVERLVTPETAAILVTHLYGLVTPMDLLLKITRDKKIFLIEDSAQSFGAIHVDGKFAGTIGDIGIYSFGMAKNVMAFYGGMVVTSSERIAKNIRKEMEHFPFMQTKKLRGKIISCLIKDIATADFLFSHFVFYIFKYGYKKNISKITKLIETELDLGRKETLPETYKERMTPFQAHLVLSKLKNVELDFQHRLQCARIYYDGLKDIPELLLPPMCEDRSHVYNYYPIGYQDRTKLRMYLMEKNRDVALQHIKNTADLPAFKDFFKNCPHSRKWANETLMMPNYPKYRLDEVRKNVAVIRDFFKR